MLEDESVDALLAITPLDLTAGIVSGLLERDVVLLIEKPPGLNPEQTRVLAEGANFAHRSHMVSFNRRFSPALMRALTYIQEDSLPFPFHASAAMVRDARRETGFVVGTGIHIIDTLCALFGPAHNVQTRSHAGRYTKSHVTDITFRDGGSATLVIAPDSGAVEERITLYGDGYTCAIDVHNCAFHAEAGRDGTTNGWTPADHYSARYRDGTLDEMRTFIALAEGSIDESSRRNPIPLPTLDTSYRSMVLAQAIADDQSGDLEDIPQ